MGGGGGGGGGGGVLQKIVFDHVTFIKVKFKRAEKFSYAKGI